ncbi:hypothetical protein L207DRAFT_580182 [Hyaloscypha variabilis F]|uniref:Fungal N-terminal domain-containing protein n=1 Tax=Hyaloscypha variabilis (strain UAMH 11265 / GT02V1 / F) TaxID=1149755 RepID=A0A2J6RXV0_HYAVF|nr:hypothetical protein L207DRAFT_580182 [Hyaloscypha variabilis F]
MPAQEVQQPQAQQMELPATGATEQPRPAEQMTAEPVSMRGGEAGDICCGIDSPLTITGNIISILTFILGVLASYLTFYTLTRHALSEIETFKQDVDTTQRQLRSVLDCYLSDSCLAPAVEHDPTGSLHALILTLTTTLDSLLREMEYLKTEHLGKDESWWFYGELCRRLRWANKRKDISQRMAKVSKLAAKEHKDAAQHDKVHDHGSSALA